MNRALQLAQAWAASHPVAVILYACAALMALVAQLPKRYATVRGLGLFIRFVDRVSVLTHASVEGTLKWPGVPSILLAAAMDVAHGDDQPKPPRLPPPPAVLTLLLAGVVLSCGSAQHPEPPAVAAHAAVHGVAHVIAAGDQVLAQRIGEASAAPHAPGAVHAQYGALVDADDGAAIAARLAEDAIDHGGACAVRDALRVLATRFALVLQLAADAGLGLSADAASAAGGIVTAADQFVPLCNVAVDAGGAQ